MIFQDPYASLNPRWLVEDIVGEPLREHGLITDKAQLKAKVGDCCKSVGLSPLDMVKYPHQFSGGQRQRISIARAWPPSPSSWCATSRPRRSTCRCRRRCSTS
jgi:peptide/nickel transport system ATP-binding protein